jgi:predicted extracellular nuclease
VLTAREIANQRKATFDAEKAAEDKRLDLEASRGKADMQSELAKSTVGIEIAGNKAEAVKREADGESYRLEKVGEASSVRTKAEGLAVAAGLEAQQRAVGKDQTAIINAVKALAAGAQRFMPQNLALTVGGEGGVSFGGLTPLLMQFLQRNAAAPATQPDTIQRQPINSSPHAGNSSPHAGDTSA